MKSVEFLIVGQGLAGTMLAFEMLDRGMDFRILYSSQKSKASMVAAGMINPLVFKRLTKSWMVDELLPVMKERYQQLEQLLNEPFFHQKQILKPLSGQEKESWKEKKQHSDYSKYIGILSDIPPINGLTEMAAYGMVEQAGYLNLSLFLEKAEMYFKQKNLLLDETFNFRDIQKNRNITFGPSKLKADKVVLCEGYHLSRDPLLPFVKMNPVKGEVLLIHAPQLSEEYIINKKVFVLPVGNHYFKVGSTYEWEDLTEQPTEKGRESILQRLDDLVTVEYTVVDHWAGVRPTIADRRPVLGQHPEYDHVFVFNGLGTKGVMLAPYFAHEMCKSLIDSNYVLPEEVNLRRFWA